MLKEIDILFGKNALHLSKVKKFMLLFWTFYSSNNPEKVKKLHSTTVFNIAINKKCFLRTKSAY